MADNVSPLAPAQFPSLPPIAGVRLASAHCGIRYQGRTDLMVALLDPGTTVAGVFTRSLMPGAPVDWCRRRCSAAGPARSSSIPATPMSSPAKRRRRSRRQRRARRTALKCDAREIFISSTGVIGEKLPAEKIVAALPAAFAAVSAGALERCRAGDHDHRHLRERRDAERDDRRRAGDDQRLRQGLGHDRARIWPRCWPISSPTRRCRPPVLQTMLVAGNRALLQFDHRRWRHLDQRHRSCSARPARPSTSA